MDVFQNNESLKLRFPRTYEALKNTGGMKMRRAMAAEDAVRTTFLGVTKEEKEFLLFEGVTKERHTSGYLHIEAKAVRKSTGEVLDQNRQVVFFTRGGEKNGLLMGLKIGQEAQKDCKVCLEWGIVKDNGVTTKTQVEVRHWR